MVDNIWTRTIKLLLFQSRYTEEDEWKKDDEGWEGIVDENEHYTDEELKDWEEEYYDYGVYALALQVGWHHLGFVR